MSLHPEPIGEIPAETVRVARAAFPKGTIVMRLRDEFGALTRMRTSEGSTRPGGSPPWRRGDWP